MEDILEFSFMKWIDKEVLNKKNLPNILWIGPFWTMSVVLKLHGDGGRIEFLIYNMFFYMIIEDFR